MTVDFSNLSPVSLDSDQFYGLIGVTTEGTARLFAPSALGGTVTSVGLSVPAGLVVTGSPVTTSGTIVLAFAPGYGIPTTVKQSEWNTAYNDKINTATFNTTNGTLTLTQQDGGTITVDLDGRYLTSVTESQTLTWNGATGELFISGGNTVDLDGRYLTSFTESDPIFVASPAAAITILQISNWDTAFDWGNHASAGYLLSATAATTYQPLDGIFSSIAGLEGTIGLLRKTAANTWSLDTATYLTGNQSITVSGDASGTGTTEIALTLANTGVTANTYRSVTVDAKGRVTAGTNPTTLVEYGITDAAPLSHVGSAGTSHGVATESDAGFMSATDKTKLDGIATGATANTGTVTSVGLSTPTGLVATGSPVTTSGTLALAYDTGYAIPTTAQQTLWDSALQPAEIGSTVLAFDSNLQSFVNAFTLPTTDGTAGQSLVTNGAGVLSFASESDPIFVASPAAAITILQISDWDTAYGWGNHASAGYLLSATAATTYQPLDDDLTSIGSLAGTTGLLRKTAANSWSLDTATYLTANQSITVSGDATGEGTTEIALTLADTGVTANTYRSVTVDAKGRVTSGTNPTTLSEYGIIDAQPLDEDLTSIAGLEGTIGLLRKTAANSWSLDTATYLTANQSITVSGDASGTGTTEIALTLANTGVTANTYRSVTVDAKGRVTAGTNPTTLSGYGITDAQPLATVLTNTTASFTTDQETKLAGIAAGAEVNVNADWNAVSGDAQILNKPTLGTAAATNSTDYATAAQGAKADTALQPAEIGSTVLAYDANLQSFVSTFTLPTTDGTANQVLATNGAGAISFATLATLPDLVYIGEVAYFNRSTKPTERSAGVALVAGDRWYKTDDQTEWSWNGTYWLGEQYSSVFAQNMAPGTKAYGNYQYNLFTTGSTVLQYVSNYVLVEAVELYLENISTSFFTGVLDASNRFNIGLNSVSTGKVTVSSLSFFNNRNGLPKQLISTPLVIPSQKTGEVMTSLLTIDGVVGSPSISWASGFNYFIIAKSRRIFE